MRKNKVRLITLYIASFLFLFYLHLPTYQMLLSAFQPWNDFIKQVPPSLYPKTITLENFIGMLKVVPKLPLYLFNSFIYGTGVALISVIVAIPAAYSIARYRFKGKNLVLLGILFTNMFSPILLIVPIYRLMRTLNLINTYYSVIIAGSIFTTPFCTWLLTSYFSKIPREIEEAAMIDGCSIGKTLIHITLPLSVPAIITALIYAFITGWSQQFILALVLIHRDELMPVTQGLYMFFARSSVRWAELMAAILTSMMIPLALFAAVQKSLVKGLTTGAIKA